jgi:hypothetical protein
VTSTTDSNWKIKQNTEEVFVVVVEAILIYKLFGNCKRTFVYFSLR